VKVALQHDPAVHAEGEIGVRVGEAASAVRIDHAVGLLHGGDDFHVPCRFAGVVLAGFEAFAFVGHVAIRTAAPGPTTASGSRRVRRLVGCLDLLGRACRRNRNVVALRGASSWRLRLGARGRRRRRWILCEDRGRRQTHGGRADDSKISARVHFPLHCPPQEAVHANDFRSLIVIHLIQEVADVRFFPPPAARVSATIVSAPLWC
jgi:hypothetical protein